MGDLATLLPYAFNIREESTVIKAIRDEEVATATKRGDVYMSFPCVGGMAGFLFRDVVLLKRSDKDVKGCSVKHIARRTGQKRADLCSLPRSTAYRRRELR